MAVHEYLPTMNDHRLSFKAKSSVEKVGKELYFSPKVAMRFYVCGHAVSHSTVQVTCTLDKCTTGSLRTGSKSRSDGSVGERTARGPSMISPQECHQGCTSGCPRDGWSCRDKERGLGALCTALEIQP